MMTFSLLLLFFFFASNLRLVERDQILGHVVLTLTYVLLFNEVYIIYDVVEMCFI